METKNNNSPKDNDQQISNNLLLRTDEINYKEIFQGIIRKRKWAFTTGLLFFIGVLVYTINERIVNPVYLGSFGILIKDPINSTGNKSNDVISSESPTFFQELASGSRRYDIDTLIFLLKSPKFLEPLAKRFDMSPVSLSGMIDISVPINTSRYRAPASVLNVNLTTRNREKGRLLLSALSERYLQESLRQRQQKLKDGLEFLYKQAPNIKEREDKYQSQLVEFRNKHKLLDPISEGESLKLQQRMVEESLNDINSTLNRLKDVRKEVINGSITALGFREILGSGLSITDFEQSLLDQLIKVESELATAKSKFTSTSSIVKGLELRLNQIQPIILKKQIDAVDTAINLNQGRLKNAEEILKKLEIKFLKQPMLIKEYSKIKQELTIANQDLLKLNSSIKSFELELAQSLYPWRLISTPKMGSVPIKPSFKKNIQFGLIISIIFGLLIALIRDRMDHVFHSAKEIKDNLNFPILGEIPYIDKFADSRDKKTELVSLLDFDTPNKEVELKNRKDTYQRFFYTEALRNLFTSIRFSKTDGALKTLSITSSLPKEGKSLLNILLAKTLNDMGEKVLIIDADMRRPQIHNRLGINNILGLSNLLTDNTISLEKVIQSIPPFKNLSVITAGTIPPDPTKLLGSKRFKEILSELKSSNEYDIIIFDTTPILGLADTILLSENLDGVILLVGLGTVDRSLPKESLIRLQTTKTNFLGIVANAIKTEYSIEYSKYGNYNRYGTYSLSPNYSPYQPIQTYMTYADNKADADAESREKKDKKNLTNESSKKEEKQNKGLFYLPVLLKKGINKFTTWLDS